MPTTAAAPTPCELWCEPFSPSGEPRWYALPTNDEIPAYILAADTESQARAECERLGLTLVS